MRSRKSHRNVVAASERCFFVSDESEIPDDCQGYDAVPERRRSKPAGFIEKYSSGRKEEETVP